MSEKPLVSVVLPVFNAEDTIETCLDSVVRQTYENMEILIVDDGSTDGTRDRLSRYSDRRIQVFYHNSNRGPGAARNTAFSQAKGSWVAFIDADDEWREDRIHYLTSLAGASDNRMVTDSIRLTVQRGGRRVPWRDAWSSEDLSLIRKRRIFDLASFLRLSRLTVQPIVPLRRMRELGVAQPNLYYSEDVDYLLRLLHGGVDLLIDERASYYYRVKSPSASSHPDRARIYRETLYRLRAELALEPHALRALDDKIALLDRQVAYAPFLQALRARDGGSALRLLLRRPSLLTELLRRVPDTLAYHWYAINSTLRNRDEANTHLRHL